MSTGTSRSVRWSVVTRRAPNSQHRPSSVLIGDDLAVENRSSRESSRVLEMEPDNYLAQAGLAWRLDLDGQFEEAVQLITQAMRIWPHPPRQRRQSVAWINLHAGRYENAKNYTGHSCNPR